MASAFLLLLLPPLLGQDSRASPSNEALREALQLQARALPPHSLAIADFAAAEAAVEKFREARSAPGADEETILESLRAEQVLLYRAGNALRDVGREEEARVRYAASLEICKRLGAGGNVRAARVLGDLAILEGGRADDEAAQRLLAEAEERLSEAGAHPDVEVGRRFLLAARGFLDYSAGRLDAAILRAAEARERALQAGDLGGAARYALEESHYLSSLWRVGRAARVLQKAIEAAPDARWRASLGERLALAKTNSGLPLEALRILEEFVDPYFDSGARTGDLPGRVALTKARALASLGRFEEAGEALGVEESLFLPGHPRLEWLGARAELAAAAGRWEEAADLARRSLEGHRGDCGDAPARERRTLGLSLLRLGRRDEAIEELRKGLATTRRWVAPIEGREDLAVRAGSLSSLASALLDALAGPGGSEDPGVVSEALEAIESSKGQALRRALLERTSESPDVDPDLEKRRRSLYPRLSRARGRLLAARDPETRERWRAELEDLEAEGDDLEREVRRRDPRQAGIRGIAGVALEELQASLPPATVAVDFFLPGRSGDENASAFALVVHRQGARLVRLGPSSALAETVGAVLGLLAREDLPRETILDAVGNLSETLIGGPLRGIGPEVRRIVVFPDGSLHLLPFEALRSPRGRRFLVEDFEVAVFPSAAASLVIAAEPPSPGGGGFLGVGISIAAAGSDRDPEAWRHARPQALARAVDEVRAAARIAGGNPILLLDESATPDALRAADLRRSDVLHFAVHGVPDEEAPGRSGLLLFDPSAPDRTSVLEAREISNLRLGGALVVLSACRSGSGPLQPGEGIRSLGRAFLEAGARSVVLALWDVRDPICLAFMDLFYRALRTGAPVGEALRRAKLECLGAPERRRALRSPAAWAAFALLGDPTGRVPLVGPSGPGPLAGLLVLLAGGLAAGATLRVLRPPRGSREAATRN